MTTAQSPLGQRLKEWRLANNLSIEDVAGRLDMPPLYVALVERNSAGPPTVISDIEALIAGPNHTAIVEAATAAIKAGLESGATVVRIVRCATPTSGRVVVVIGGDDVAWEREE
jgi:hypothetical protein